MFLQENSSLPSCSYLDVFRCRLTGQGLLLLFNLVCGLLHAFFFFFFKLTRYRVLGRHCTLMQNVSAYFHRKGKIGVFPCLQSSFVTVLCTTLILSQTVKAKYSVTYFYSPIRILCQLTPVCLFVFKCQITEQPSPKDERKQCFHVQEIWGYSNRTFSLWIWMSWCFKLLPGA